MSSRKIKASTVFLAAISLTACVRREGRNTDCRWPENPEAKTLRSARGGYVQGLREDVEFAEELAVEFMDAHHGPRSAHFQSHRAANQAFGACLDTLLVEIGNSRDIPKEQVANAFGRRNLVTDVAMNLPFLALYCVLAAMWFGRLLRRYPPEEGWIATLVMVILSSLAFSLGGMLIGENWSIAAESIRVGSGHLSYRQDRLPWVRHEFDFFVFCLALFWGAAVVRYRVRSRERVTEGAAAEVRKRRPPA